MLRQQPWYVTLRSPYIISLIALGLTATAGMLIARADSASLAILGIMAAVLFVVLAQRATHVVILALFPAYALSPTFTLLPPPFAELRVSDFLFLILAMIAVLEWRSSRQTLAQSSGVRRIAWMQVLISLSLIVSTIYGALRLGAPLTAREIMISLEPLQWTVYVLVVTLVVVRHQEKVLRWLYQTVAWTTLIVTAIALLQYLRIFEVRQFLDTYYPKFNLDRTQFTAHLQRVTSTFDGSPNVFATYLTFATALLLSYVLLVNRRSLVAWLAITAAIFVQILTGSRAQQLAMLSIFAFYAVWIQRRLLIVLVVIPALFLVISPEQQLSRWEQLQIDDASGQVILSGGVEVRANVITRLLPVVASSPLLGVGTSGFAGSTSDNFYLRVLVDSGVVGLVLQLVQYGTIFVLGLNVAQNTSARSTRALAIALCLIVAAVLIGNIAARTLYMPRIAELFWLLTGIVCAIDLHRRQTADQLAAQR